MATVVWFIAAAAAIASALGVILQRNPFISAIALLGNLASLATMYILLQSDFVAVAQVIVYAGAVMVMFLFVIAYLGRHADAPWAGGPSWQALGAVAAAGALMVEIVVVVGLKASGRLSAAPDVGAAFGSPSEIGRVFLSDHLLAFEITSIVLLVAAVGGVVLGMRSEAEDEADVQEAAG